MSYELHLGDALEYMATLPDASIDLLLTDPPYGTTSLSWDVALDWSAIWPEVYRVCKPNAVQVVFSAQPFTTDLINSNRKRFRYDLVWDKKFAGNFMLAKTQPMKTHEILCFFGATGIYNPQMTKRDKVIRAGGMSGAGAFDNSYFAALGKEYSEKYPISILNFPRDIGKSGHPTQKPLELLCYLVKTYSNPGDTVLDLFSGSGTTGVACLLTDRTFVGCEIDENYFNTASKRLAAVAAQSRLEFA